MSAAVFWRPMGNGKRLPNGDGILRTLLEKTLGAFPLQLQESDAEKLRLIARVDGSRIEALEELADAIDVHSEIEVWAEY